MAQHSLKSTIVIAGSVDSSFGKISQTLDSLGNTLLNIGSYVDQFSQKILSLGKESLLDYANFDDLLRKVQSVSQMSEKELAVVEEATREMGRTTRYTAEDAAEASLILAQVGLNYKDIVDLLPDVLRLAQAGDMSIADASDYLYASLKSMGYGLAYADTLIDQMAKTAAIGATDVDTLGESLTRIGSGLSLFKGGSTEVLTILSAMSEFGGDMRGSEGGTALRNFMLSLAAPSGNRQATVAMLENVGASMEELDEIMEDVDLTSAARAIQDMGLDVYDAQGNLRGAIDIITSLRDSVSGLNEEAKYNALSQIFGKRTLTTALNLISLTDAEWNNLQADISDSAGFADFMAMTQEGGIGGSIRLLKSQWEEFKLSLGEAIEPKAQDAMAFVGDILNSLSNLDEDKMNTLVNGLGAVAIAGPGLLAVGGALKFMAFLASPGGAIALGVVGLTALALILHDIEERNFKGTFGDMELDMGKLKPYVDSLSGSLRDANPNIAAFGEAAETAAEKYETAATAFSSDLLTARITGQQFTEADQEKLQALGADAVAAVMEGIETSRAKSLNFIDYLLLQDDNTDNEFNHGARLVAQNNQYYDALYGQAAAIGENIRKAIAKGLEGDGTLSAEEWAAIMAEVERLNQIEAEITRAKNAQAYEILLKKGQSVSWDSFDDFAQMLLDGRDTALADADELWYSEYGFQASSNKAAIERALAAGDAWEAARLEAEWKHQTEPALDAERAATNQDINTRYGTPLSQVFGGLMYGNEYGEGYSIAQRIFADLMRDAGGDVGALDYAGWDYGKYFAGMPLEQAREAQQQMLTLAGDSNRLAEHLKPFKGTMPEIDAMLSFLEAAKQIPAQTQEFVNLAEGVDATAQTQRQQAYESRLLLDPNATPEPKQTEPYVPVETYGQSYWDGIANFFRETPVPLEVAPSDPTEDGTAYKDVFEAAAASDLEISTDDPYASGAAYGSAWAEGASSTAVFTPTARYAAALGGGSKSGSGSSSSNKNSGNSSSKTNKLFAEGGRANAASIFGEAGPEWAIPEEHSARTAALLDAARAASGFTWPELLARTGGLNAGAPAPTLTLVYSPTIQAADAAGVRAELLADKARLEKWLEDQLAERKLLAERMSYT